MRLFNPSHLDSLPRVFVYIFIFINYLFSKEYNLDSLIKVYSTKPKFGIFVGYGFNHHFASFKSLPYIPCCSPEFSYALGRGWIGGIFGEYLIDTNFSFSGRVSFLQNDAYFSKKEFTNVIVDGLSQNGIFEHQLNTWANFLLFEIRGNYRFFDNWILSFGSGFSYNLYNRFHQKEIIVEPVDRGVFPNGLRIRNEFAGEINNFRGLLPFVGVAVSKELSFHHRGAFYLLPEFNYYLHFIDQVKGLNWKSQQFRLGVAIKYREPIPPPPPPPPPIDPPAPELPRPLLPPTIDISLDYIYLDSAGKELSSALLKIEDFVSLNMKPLLNYVFFDDNSDVLPPRYVQLTPKEAEKFNLSQLSDKDLLETYYQILNIIGKKMKLDPAVTVKLVGTNSNKGNEKNNKDLSLRRALAVKKYLIDVWGIEPSRFQIEARNLPKEPSNPNDLQGDEENRRVEIIPSDLRIIEPLLSVDTLRKVEKSTVVIYPRQKSGEGIKEWSINITQNSKIIKQFKGFGAPPKEIKWEINDKAFEKVVFGGNLNFEFIATDSIDQFGRAIAKPLDVQKITVDKKRLEGVADREYEYYSLILFDFGKSKLDAQHKSVLDFITRRVTPSSQVTIEGFTDNIGEVKINQRISERRAKEVAKWLGLSNAKTVGVGEDYLLYDNSLPEGRFYCRTVRITIETPIKVKSK
ncbi:MAG: OmpA family protein [Candidatus Kapaibacteriales bacterium]